jgi:predicted acyl esterase
VRDGTRLPADFYFPSDKPWQSPAVLIRSPAGKKNLFALQFLSLLKDGYVVVIQDTRSAIDKEGKTFPFWHDGWGTAQDGYDTIEWLASSPFSNGKIGTVGDSALGISQYMLAPTAPPSLKCQYVGNAAPSIYHYAIFNGGQIQKELVESWLSWYASDSGIHSYASNQYFYNDFWKRFNALDYAHQVQVPAIHYGGWYDVFLTGTLDAFTSLQNKGGEGAKGKQKLLIGPWTHLWPKDVRYGDFEMPVSGISPPVDLSHVAWLNFHLKGMDNGIDRLPAVTYYVMGPFDGSESSGNIWKHADDWPPESEKAVLYFSSENGLIKTIPQEGEVAYASDPINPIPTLGGRNLFLESGPKDQRSIESRDDVVVFTSDLMDHDMEITGEITAKLYLISDQKDSDIIVRVTDVYPDGKSIFITEGIYRLGTDGHLSAKNVQREIEIKLAPTSFVFAKGHRIRTSISSSNYPRYERNMNSGLFGSNSGNSNIVNHTLKVGKNAPSQLIFPVIK